MKSIHSLFILFFQILLFTITISCSKNSGDHEYSGEDLIPCNIDTAAIYKISYYTYYWDVNNGGRYEYGPDDCYGKILYLGKGDIQIEYCGRYMILSPNSDCKFIGACDNQEGSIYDKGFYLSYSSNPCNQPGHGKGGYWYKTITGTKI